VLPLVLLLHPRIGQMRRRVTACAALVVGGGFAQMYVTIIGGQAFPLVIFPGRQVSSSFSDGVINTYSPSLPEWLLGFGGIAIVGIIVMVALKVMGFLPERLDDETLQQHAASVAVAHA
jgi:molybdopterin-containing oxidoreductase family membrane subunit